RREQHEIARARHFLQAGPNGFHAAAGRQQAVGDIVEATELPLEVGLGLVERLGRRDPRVDHTEAGFAIGKLLRRHGRSSCTPLELWVEQSTGLCRPYPSTVGSRRQVLYRAHTASRAGLSMGNQHWMSIRHAALHLIGSL